MDQTYQPSMAVHIVLLQDSTVTKSTRRPLVYHCGQEIDGHLEVVTSSDFVFDIDVSFEGC
jgi:hypothetical protein